LQGISRVSGFREGSKGLKGGTQGVTCVGEQCNFFVYYEVDDDEVPTALRLDEYGIEGEGGWVLLEAAAVEADAADAEVAEAEVS
jgi:hypothetical protein